jgi:tellurite resistance protein
MGLLSSVFGNQPSKKPADDVLLLLSMMLMAEADEVVEDSEAATFTAFAQTLPEFRDVEGLAWERMVNESQKILSRYKNREIEAVSELNAIQSPAIRRKAFVLAADLALASGDIDAREEQLLVAMQRTLGIDDQTAHAIVQVLGFKYAR